MSPGRELPANHTNSSVSSSNLPVTVKSNHHFDMLDVTKETNSLLQQQLNNNNSSSNNSNNNNNNNVISVVMTTTEVKKDGGVEEKKISKSPDDVLKMHPIYLNTEEFSQSIEPPLGKIARNSYNFDVIIEGAATPSNFYVRNYRTSKALEILENNMFDYYTNYYHAVDFHMGNLMLNGYYVLKKDNKYFRVRTVRPFNRKGELVMVELLDYGGFVQVQPLQLLPLKKSFAECLPTQAFKAKLQVPQWSTTIKWSPEDCARFKNEYEGKSLVALILSESIDDLTNERCLGCLLVDTSSGNKDVYIHLQFSDNKNK